MRIGTKKKPFYRVVVLDERAKRTGAYIELLGIYNPLTEPKDIKLKKDRIDYWIKQGAQPSTGFLRIIGKAPQRPPRKPKKERKQATGDNGPAKSEEAAPAEKPVKTEEKATEETAKSSESEAAGEVESAPKEGTSEESTSQQAHSEAQDQTSEPETSQPSDASITDEPAAIEPTTTEGKKETDERPA